MVPSTTGGANELIAAGRLDEQTRRFGRADDRRRVILAVLEARSTPLTVGELARTVVARAGSDSGIVRLDEVVLWLHHQDLPLLDDAGIVTYDPETRRVTLNDERDELR